MSCRSWLDSLPTVSFSRPLESCRDADGGWLADEELVKEVFAPQLDRIMWHFFSVGHSPPEETSCC